MAKERESDFTVIKIAMGVVLGLLVMKACDRYEEAQAIKQANAEIEKIVKSWPKPEPYMPPAPQGSTRATPTPLPLQPDERCINKQRFRRVENGWIQNGTC